jgi:hypothetical protein
MGYDKSTGTVSIKIPLLYAYTAVVSNVYHVNLDSE